MNTISILNFLAADICNDHTAGIGSIRRYQSNSIPMTPVGIETFAKVR